MTAADIAVISGLLDQLPGRIAGAATVARRAGRLARETGAPAEAGKLEAAAADLDRLVTIVVAEIQAPWRARSFEAADPAAEEGLVEIPPPGA